jgi:hypothetical protein
MKENMKIMNDVKMIQLTIAKYGIKGMNCYNDECKQKYNNGKLKPNVVVLLYNI